MAYMAESAHKVAEGDGGVGLDLYGRLNSILAQQRGLHVAGAHWRHG